MRSYFLAAAAAGFLSAASPAAAATVHDRDEAALAVEVPVPAEPSGFRDEVMMVLVGSALIGLAAALRRSA